MHCLVASVSLIGYFAVVFCRVDASSSPARVSVVVYTTYIALYVLGAAACVLFASRDRAAAARAAVVAPSAPVVKVGNRCACEHALLCL